MGAPFFAELRLRSEGRESQLFYPTFCATKTVSQKMGHPPSYRIKRFTGLGDWELAQPRSALSMEHLDSALFRLTLLLENALSLFILERWNQYITIFQIHQRNPSILRPHRIFSRGAWRDLQLTSWNRRLSFIGYELSFEQPGAIFRSEHAKVVPVDLPARQPISPWRAWSSRCRRP